MYSDLCIPRTSRLKDPRALLQPIGPDSGASTLSGSNGPFPNLTTREAIEKGRETIGEKSCLLPYGVTEHDHGITAISCRA